LFDRGCPNVVVLGHLIGTHDDDVEIAFLAGFAPRERTKHDDADG
jgi:hypothetical protein